MALDYIHKRVFQILLNIETTSEEYDELERAHGSYYSQLIPKKNYSLELKV